MNKSARYQCHGKQKLKEHEAVATAERAQSFGDALEAYPCRHCGTWHTGHAYGASRTEAEASKAWQRKMVENLRQHARRLDRR